MFQAIGKYGNKLLIDKMFPTLQQAIEELYEYMLMRRITSGYVVEKDTGKITRLGRLRLD